MPALHHLVFYRPDALPAAQPTASKPNMIIKNRLPDESECSVVCENDGARHGLSIEHGEQRAAVDVPQTARSTRTADHDVAAVDRQRHCHVRGRRAEILLIDIALAFIRSVM